MVNVNLLRHSIRNKLSNMLFTQAIVMQNVIRHCHGAELDIVNKLP
jgi:hypothetical protein